MPVQIYDWLERFRCTFWALNMLVRCKSYSSMTDTKFMISTRYGHA